MPLQQDADLRTGSIFSVVPPADGRKRQLDGINIWYEQVHRPWTTLGALLAEFEWDLLRERVRSGIAARRKRGGVSDGAPASA